MAQRHQRGWLKQETRSQGKTWVLFFRTTRKSDGKRVETKVPVGLVKDFPDESDAREEVKRMHLPVNQVNSQRGITFGDLAQHYAEHELVDQRESIHAKAHNGAILRTNPPKSTAAAMGKQDCSRCRTAGGGAMAERSKARKKVRESDSRQDSPCHVTAL